MPILEAIYEEGHLKLSTPLDLEPGQKVGVILARTPDPARWDSARFPSSEAEDRMLAESGVVDWLDALDDEDRL